MAIDERLNRLTQRHGALTGHVELLTADIRQMKERMDDLTANMERQRRTMDDLMLGFSTLVEPARGHERRIQHLEGV